MHELDSEQISDQFGNSKNRTHCSMRTALFSPYEKNCIYAWKYTKQKSGCYLKNCEERIFFSFTTRRTEMLRRFCFQTGTFKYRMTLEKHLKLSSNEYLNVPICPTL